MNSITPPDQNPSDPAAIDQLNAPISPGRETQLFAANPYEGDDGSLETVGKQGNTIMKVGLGVAVLAGIAGVGVAMPPVVAAGVGVTGIVGFITAFTGIGIESGAREQAARNRIEVGKPASWLEEQEAESFKAEGNLPIRGPAPLIADWLAKRRAGKAPVPKRPIPNI